MFTAYLDPATGSAIIGAVAAGAAGASVAAKTMLGKMRFKKSAMAETGLGDAEVDAEVADDTTT